MTDSTAIPPVIPPAAQAAPAAAPGTWFGHPRGLATLFFTEMWERFSYYGMRALLVLYMTAAAGAGGLGLSQEHSGAVYGLFTAGAYLSALPGGWVADRVLGARRSVIWGGLGIALGNFLLVVPHSTVAFYIGLVVIAFGTGFLKPNASCLVGELYRNDSGSRRDAGFSIYYVGINVGALLAPFVIGTVGETAGYRWGFLLVGIAMIAGVVQYRFTAHWLGDAGLHPHPAPQAQQRRARWLFAAASVALALVVAAAALGLVRLDAVRLASLAGLFMLLLALFFFGSVLLVRSLTAAEKKRIAVIAVFFVCSALFWAGYEQAGTSLNIFARDYTDRSFLGSLFPSGEHPVSWYQAPQAVFVLSFAPLFAWIWLRLGARGADPSPPAKFGLGLLQLGASFLVMMLAAQIVLHTGHRVLPWWLIFTYLLQTTGELFLSPIGLSNVTKLAPARYSGQMMGTWFLGMALGNLMAGLIGGEVGGSIAELPHQFLQMALVAGVSGAVTLAIARPLKRWIGGVA
ncbi:MAG TPA: peptide MFS transporter [Steroidobacteraceae bacterium]|nr:peptide MFS transporter [Steroidobacteraceae bacterium]